MVCTLYEGGTKVPAFVSGLGLKPRIESRMFHIKDWYPTILGAVDPLEVDDRLDGVNQLEALKDETFPGQEVLCFTI
jgi:arylsulfatase A-like enzyme